MTVTAVGFDGTITEDEWAQLSRLLGVRYCVGGQTHLAVTGTSGTRAVSIATGRGYGHGVSFNSDAVATVNLSANAGSATRYDTIVARVNWSTNAVTFAAITGTSTNTVATLENTPGVLADVPLAVVPVAVGVTDLSAVTVYDHRQWPASVLTGQYRPRNPNYGSLHLLASGNLARWTSSWDSVTDPAWTNLTMASGYAGAGRTPAYRVLAGHLELRGEIRRSNNGAFPTGDFTTFASVPADIASAIGADWPRSVAPFEDLVSGTPSTANPGYVRLSSAGLLQLQPGATGQSQAWLDGVRIPLA